MRRIKIAQIGINRYSHAAQIFSRLKKNADVFEIAGYALVENEREEIPWYHQIFEGFQELTLEEILNDPGIEAVTVETEEKHLTRYALLAARYGKHIHMEKPGGIGAIEFEKLIKTMRSTGKTFHMGYMYRYNPYIAGLLEQVKNGRLGEIISVEAQMSCPEPLDCRKWLENYKGGMMFFLGCHLIDLIFQIKGKPDNVRSLNRSTGRDGTACEDYGMVVFEYRDGISFAKTYGYEIGGFLRRQLVVTGTKGMVELKPLEVGSEDGMYTERNENIYDPAEKVWDTPGIHSKSVVFDRYDNMLRSFAAMVRGEKVNPYTLDYELELYKLILKCCEVN